MLEGQALGVVVLSINAHTQAPMQDSDRPLQHPVCLAMTAGNVGKTWNSTWDKLGSCPDTQSSDAHQQRHPAAEIPRSHRQLLLHKPARCHAAVQTTDKTVVNC